MTHDQKRFWGHFPLGFYTGLLYIFPPAGIGLTNAFLAYEAIQDWRKVDHSYKDIIGWLVGLAFGLAFATGAIVTALYFTAREILEWMGT